MRFTDEDLRTLRLALEVWTEQESEGGTASQKELDEADKLWQKLTREVIRRKEKATA